MELSGRRVLITGASSGIGLVLARELARRGAATVLLARDPEGLADAGEGLEGCAGTIAADVGDAEAVAAAVAQAVELLGGLDAVVCGAGAAAYGPFAQAEPESLEARLRTTLLGTLNTAHARTPDRRLPPEIRGAYRPQEVAAEVIRALEETPARLGWHLERTVGALMLPAVLVDALVPNLVLPPLGVLARWGWRARERAPVNPDGGLERPGSSGEESGGLRSRASALRLLRDLLNPRR